MIKKKHRHRLRSWALLAVTLAGMANCVSMPALAATPVTPPVTQRTTNAVTGISAETYRNSSALELAAMVRSGRVTSTQLVKLAYAQIKADNPKLNGVITMRENAALQEAAALKDTGQPFLGVPILLKGLLQHMAGTSDTQGLLSDKGNITGATGTWPIVKKLQDAGFIVLGQTNFPELGLLNVTTSMLYGNAHNAWNTDYQPGGSSGGSATSTADGMVPLAMGNDSGGSIRIPASWSGLIGFKPTQGVIIGDSLKQHTVNFGLTKTMTDTESLFNMLQLPNAVVEKIPASLKGLRIAYTLKSPVHTKVSNDAVQAVMKAVDFLRQQGFQVEEASPEVDGVSLMKAYYVGATVSGFTANNEAKRFLKRPLEKRDVSPLTWGLFQAGNNVKPLVLGAQAAGATAITKTAEFRQKYPLFLSPTTATTAPKITDPAILPGYASQLENMESVTAGAAQMQLIYDAWLHGLSKTPFTQQANITGEPAISLPTYVSKEGMPLGVQFTAAKGQDRTLMALGKLFEQHQQFKMLHHSQSVPQPFPSLPVTVPQEVPDTTEKPVIKPGQNSSSTTPVMKTAKIKKVIYVTSKFDLYRDMTKRQVKKHYGQHSRRTAPSFKVTGLVTLPNGQKFYRVKQGYIRVARGIHNQYYQRVAKRVKVISRHGIYEYRNKQMRPDKRLKFIKVGRVLHVKRLVHYGAITRYQLTNGHYVTANRQFVQW